MSLQGGCHCGAVRYETDAEPFNRTLCHCVDCRRTAGAPAVAWFTVPSSRLRFTAGSPARRTSSPGVERGFCAACGTALTWQSRDLPEEIDVATASLDEPEAAAPRDHTFASQRLSWMRADDGLPVYPRRRADGLAADELSRAPRKM